MDDHEYGRLDDKIIAAEERGSLRLETALAKIDGQFSAMRGEIREAFAAASGRLDHIEKATSNIKTTVVTTVIGAAIGTIGIVVAILAYGQGAFGIGINTHDMLKAVVTEVVNQQHQTPATKP